MSERTTTLTIRVYPVGTGLLTQCELDQIAAWHDTEFSQLPISKRYEWAVGGQFNVLLNVDGEFAGFVGLMKREALFDGQKTLIAAIRGLVVDARWRKQGLGRLIMTEAHKVIFRTLKAEHGFLLCLPELEPFYASLGWQTLRCPVTVENGTQKVVWTEIAMLLSNGDASISDRFQSIDLMGKAF